jgi:hypothetical protein
MRLALLFAAMLVLVPSAGARQVAGPAPFHTGTAPWGLHAFVYRADEPTKADHTYAMLPAFAWNAVKEATSYEVQLATSSTFSDSTVLKTQFPQTPVASIQRQVPWMTGNPYALWVHVRAVAHGRTSPWSTPYGFNTAWQQVPKQEPAPTGLIRWTAVDGATSYDVWYVNGPNGDIHFSTLTNVADEREYWMDSPPLAGTIKWRVRAVRLVQTDSSPLQNGIPTESHGPYSPTFTTTNRTALSAAPMKSVSAASDVESTPTRPHAHQLTPGFAWTGTQDTVGQSSNAQLSRVYIFSDEQCVNLVMTGSAVGGPAWAPRNITSPRAALAPAGETAADGTEVRPDEWKGASPASGSAPAAGSANPATPGTSPAVNQHISLPDNGWPEGRYWWTVVPVDVSSVTYQDLALPQDSCEAGQVWPFGVQSTPLTTAFKNPYVSGVTTGTRVVSATRRAPTFQSLPLITWKPASAARTYEIELSRHAYPWVAVKTQTSVVTSAVLSLTRKDKGVWFYRVRGINPNLIGPAQKLAWSHVVEVRISGDRFVIVK